MHSCFFGKPKNKIIGVWYQSIFLPIYTVDIIRTINERVTFGNCAINCPLTVRGVSGGSIVEVKRII